MPGHQTTNALITGGSFTTTHVHASPAEKNTAPALELLNRHITPGAFHNSAERCDAPKCHPDTRKAIIKEIIDWTEGDSDTHPFLWMYGPVGTGKSSIAQSIAELLHKAGKLAASFFFSRTAAGRNTDSRLFATIAYQLTLSIPRFSDHIFRALDRDPAIFSKSLGEQLDTLIAEPLMSCNLEIENQLKDMGPRLIIIDGLDECGEGKSQHHILSVLFSAIQNSSIRLFFLIASRPEHSIRTFFNQKKVNPVSRRLVLDDKYQPDMDIQLFLQSRFDDIKRDHPLQSNLPSSWPSHSDLDQLIQKASGQFIYASTVMKFVQSPQHRPIDRLNIIFGLMAPGKNLPFADLDALYTHIFMSVEDIEHVLDTFAFLLSNDLNVSADMDFIEDFLCFQRGDLQIILNDLHSIIYVPMAGQGSEPLHLFHASLGDFLLDRNRSNDFFIGAGKVHARITTYCIKHLAYVFTSTYTNINLTILKISYPGLMQHCLMSDPTDDLLKALYTFDFGAYLNMPFGIYSSDLCKRQDRFLPFFFSWIPNQKDPTIENDLKHQYMAHLDSYLKTRLSLYWRYDNSPELFHLLTASTLTSFASHCRAVLDILAPLYKHHSTLANLDKTGLWFKSANDSNFKNFHHMITEFLTNKSRAGIYHVNGVRYGNLAQFFDNAFTKPCGFGYFVRDTTMSKPTERIQHCALDILLEAHSQSALNTRLCKQLRNKSILADNQSFTRITEEKKKEALLLIQSIDKESQSIAGDRRLTDVIILVMGYATVGTSTFINTLLRDPKQQLTSATKMVQAAEIGFVCAHPQIKSRRLLLVDTPSFNHTDMKAIDVLHQVSSYLEDSYLKKHVLAGVIHLHSLSSSHFRSANDRRCFAILPTFCGDTALKNVILGTTHWNQDTEDKNLKQESLLRDIYWKPMVKQGSVMLRFKNDHASAWQFVNTLLHRTSEQGVILDIQRELVDKQKPLSKTKTAQEHFLDQNWQTNDEKKSLVYRFGRFFHVASEKLK